MTILLIFRVKFNNLGYILNGDLQITSYSNKQSDEQKKTCKITASMNEFKNTGYQTRQKPQLLLWNNILVREFTDQYK